MNVPIRVRLTMWYGALLAVIVIALGTFVIVQLRSDLRGEIDDEIRASSATLVRAFMDETSDDPAERPGDSAADAEDFADSARAAMPHAAAGAQVIDGDGRVLMRYGPVADTGRLADTGARAAALADGPRTFTAELGADEQRYRVRVAPFSAGRAQRFMVVAETLQPVEDAVQRALVLLLIAGPIGLVATTLTAYWLAAQALRPVTRMSSDAQEIGADQLDERIAVPASHDEIGHLAVTLNAMLDRLEHGVAEKRRLVADASHELRTPLAVMRAEIQVSLRGDEMSPAARQVLESAREEVDRMSRSVDNLLTLAEADEGRLHLLTRPVTLGEALESAAGPLRSLATAKSVSLEVDGGPWLVQADVQRLNQAFTNLIENAIKFTPSGGHVRALGWRRDGEVGLTITDDGPGIRPEDREHLFDRYYRVGSARGGGVGGSGLGLAICREVVLAHGGRIWVDAVSPHGSAFTLMLPSWRSVPTDLAAATAASFDSSD